MRHKDIWRGIDQLAAHHGLTPSGLARRAGLDPTAFNPSKREGADGRPRWPSSESLARVLDAVGSGFDDFAALIDGRRGATAPLIGFAQAGQDGYFDDAGFPLGRAGKRCASPASARKPSTPSRSVEIPWSPPTARATGSSLPPGQR